MPDLRFAPESDRVADIAEGSIRLMHRNKTASYSITSSARARSDGGISRPRVLAVFRLIASSNGDPEPHLPHLAHPRGPLDAGQDPDVVHSSLYLPESVYEALRETSAAPTDITAT